MKENESIPYRDRLFKYSIRESVGSQARANASERKSTRENRMAKKE